MSVPEKGSNGMRFDRTVTLGHLLIMITLMVGGAATFTTIQVNLADHDRRIKTLEKNDERLNDMIKWVYDIKSDLAVIKSKLERAEAEAERRRK